mgnify:CR=1 FL=1
MVLVDLIFSFDVFFFKLADLIIIVFFVHEGIKLCVEFVLVAGYRCEVLPTLKFCGAAFTSTEDECGHLFAVRLQFCFLTVRLPLENMNALV